MRLFAEAGCTIGVLAMPFLPGISDTKESVDALFAELARVGAHFVLPAGLTLTRTSHQLSAAPAVMALPASLRSLSLLDVSQRIRLRGLWSLA